MSAADWPGQNSSPEAEIGRQDAATSSRQTTLSAAMAPAATHFRLPRPAPEARVSAPRSASPVATATRPGPRCARASRRPELGVCGRGHGWGLGWGGSSVQSRSPGCSFRCAGVAVAWPVRVAVSAVRSLTRGQGELACSHRGSPEQHDARHSCCRVLYSPGLWAGLTVGTGRALSVLRRALTEQLWGRRTGNDGRSEVPAELPSFPGNACGVTVALLF